MKKYILTLSSFMFISCGDKTQVEVQGDISSLLTQGRSVHYDQSSTSNLSLTSDSLLLEGNRVNVFRSKRNSDQSLSFVEFDTSKTVLAEGNDLRQACLNIVEENTGSLGVSADELVDMKNTNLVASSDMRYITFARNYQGLDVRDAYFQCVFTKNNDQWSVNSIDNATLANIPYGKQSTSTDKSSLDFSSYPSLSGANVLDKKRLWLPRTVGDSMELSEALEVTVEKNDGVKTTITVAIDSGDVLEAYNHQYHAKQQIRAEVLNRTKYYENDKLLVSIPQTEFTIDNNTVLTDLEGQLEVDQASVQGLISLKSNRVTVGDGSYNNLISLNFDIPTREGSIDIKPKSQSELAAYNAYLGIHRVVKFARKHVSESEVSLLEDGVQMRINYQGDCNAFYVNRTITLYAAGNGCENMAFVNDVNYHEWGHGYDDYTGIRGGITDGAFSEAAGDIIAAYLTESSNMAPGFFIGKEAGIRQLNNNKTYPESVTDSVHTDGLIVGGAFWDMRVALVERYGRIRGSEKAERYFFRHMLVTDSYLKSYENVLKLDDDDNNPATQSPNYCLITEAFANHGLATENNCEDEVKSLNYGEDSSISFAVYEEVSDKVKIHAAAKGATSILVCMDNVDNCDSQEKFQDIGLEFNGTKDELMMFTDSDEIDFKSLSKMTFMSMNQTEVIGVKEFKIIEK